MTTTTRPDLDAATIIDAIRTARARRAAHQHTDELPPFGEMPEEVRVAGREAIAAAVVESVEVLATTIAGDELRASN